MSEQYFEAMQARWPSLIVLHDICMLDLTSKEGGTMIDATITPLNDDELDLVVGAGNPFTACGKGAVAGGAGGAVSGAIGGSFVGGVGAGPGALAGGAGGAVGGCISGAILSLW